MWCLNYALRHTSIHWKDSGCFSGTWYSQNILKFQLNLSKGFRNSISMLVWTPFLDVPTFKIKFLIGMVGYLKMCCETKKFEHHCSETIRNSFSIGRLIYGSFKVVSFYILPTEQMLGYIAVLLNTFSVS